MIGALLFVPGSLLDRYLGGDPLLEVVGLSILALVALLSFGAYLRSVRERTHGGALLFGLVGTALAVLFGVLAGTWEWGVFFGGVGAFVGSLLNLSNPRREGELVLASLLGLLGIGVALSTGGLLPTAFFGASAVALVGGWRVLKVRENVHAALWLAVVLSSVALLFVLAQAPFLASIQILIYVGAIVTLFLYTLMLTVSGETQAVDISSVILPKGWTVQGVGELQRVTPLWGHGPHKALKETNPRRPVRVPPNLYGVSLDDGVVGSESETVESRKKEGS